MPSRSLQLWIIIDDQQQQQQQQHQSFGSSAPEQNSSDIYTTDTLGQALLLPTQHQNSNMS
jgi:hypothetical protein